MLREYKNNLHERARSQRHLHGKNGQQRRRTHCHVASSAGGIAQISLAGVALLHLNTVGHSAFVLLLSNPLEVAVAGDDNAGAICFRIYLDWFIKHIVVLFIVIF